jgi:hypothetical protein
VWWVVRNWDGGGRESVSGVEAGIKKKQIPGGNDRKKGNGNDNDNDNDNGNGNDNDNDNARATATATATASDG